MMRHHSVLWMLACLGTATLLHAGEKEAVEDGKKVFAEKRCASCHTIGGHGQEGKRDLDKYGSYADPLLLGAALWNHAPGMAAKQDDPEFEALKPWPKFEPGQLISLVRYLHDASGSDQHQYIASANYGKGKTLFQERCSTCHSVVPLQGKVDLVPRLRQAMSRADVAALMWNHVPTMLATMKSKGVQVPRLDASEMADLFTYLLNEVEKGFLQEEFGAASAPQAPGY